MAVIQLSTLGSVIKPAYEGQPNTNAFTDDIKEKFEGIDLTSTVTMFELGAVGDGVADDTAAWLAALATGKPIILGYNKKYRITGNGQTLTARSAIIIGNNSEFIVDEPTPIGCRFLLIDIPFLEIQSVSSVAKIVSYDISGTSAGACNVSSISVSDGSKYKVGEVCKIVANDFFAGSHATQQMRNGEFITIGAIDGNTVYTRSPLRYEYTTGVRLAKVDLSKKVVLRDFTVKLGPNCPVGSGFATALRINGAYEPYADISCDTWPTHFIDLYGCYHALTDGVRAKDLFTNQSQNRYGYAIAETGCEGSLHMGLAGTNVRHVYTTNGIPTPADSSDISRFGRNYGSIVVGGVAKNCQNAGFDTHPDGHNVGFIGCSVSGGYRGPNGYEGAFQLRGIDCFAYDCISESQGGIFFESGGAGTGAKGPTLRPRVKNFVHKPPEGITDVYPYGIIAGGTAGVGDQVTDIMINGFTAYIPAGATAPVGRFNYANAFIKNIHIKADLATAQMNIIQTSHASLVVRDMFVDISGSTAAGARLFKTFSSADVIDVDGLEIKAGSVAWDDLVDYNNNAAVGSFTNVKWDAAPTDADGYTNGAGATHSMAYAGGWSTPWLGQSLEDHFTGFSVNSEKWLTSHGTHASSAVGIQANTQRGAARLTFGQDAGATMALNGAQISGARCWRPSDGDMFVEARFNPSSASSTALFIGFMDDTALKIPFTMGAGDAVTANTVDAVGILFDTAADNDVVWGVGVKNGVVATAINLGNALVSGGQVRWRVSVDKTGVASFFRNGVRVGGAMPDAVTASVILSPVVCGFSRNTTAKYVALDYLSVKQGVL